MSRENVIRAWKDPEYRASLSSAERSALPEHPAGLVELEPVELNRVAGGASYLPKLNTYVCVFCHSQGIHNGWNIAARG